MRRVELVGHVELVATDHRSAGDAALHELVVAHVAQVELGGRSVAVERVQQREDGETGPGVEGVEEPVADLADVRWIVHRSVGGDEDGVVQEGRLGEDLLALVEPEDEQRRRAAGPAVRESVEVVVLSERRGVVRVAGADVHVQRAGAVHGDHGSIVDLRPGNRGDGEGQGHAADHLGARGGVEDGRGHAGHVERADRVGAGRVEERIRRGGPGLPGRHVRVGQVHPPDFPLGVVEVDPLDQAIVPRSEERRTARDTVGRRIRRVVPDGVGGGVGTVGQHLAGLCVEHVETVAPGLDQVDAGNDAAADEDAPRLAGAGLGAGDDRRAPGLAEPRGERARGDHAQR